ncbi:carbohydrate ABC transporter permease [Salinibacterium sp. SWN1162]|uniref:carbohydrate ABC transporter permease n=1 Tax=Salinibacterium sp. SWN1162 TaxID=2792053 RepID=UPI0018CF9AB5|nr:carbohydrate ABC transporter permease [Salinibacterium sp. SWN1162]MBH0008390.1 carbohydrate ABC transporter permease [Salinibacterium sp. SWN1162]
MKTGKSRSRLPKGSTFLIYLGIVLVLLAFALPLLFVVNTALKTQGDFFVDPAGVTQTLQWSNIVDAWNTVDFGRYLINSVVYTLVCATVGTFASLLMAFPVARNFMRGSGAWNAVFVLGLFLPVALVTQFQMLLRLGLYDTQIGYMLLLSASVGIGPLLIVGYLRTFPLELDEAAAIDGVGYFRYLFTFVAPLSTPVLVTAFILQALTVWNEIILATVVFSDENKYPASLGLKAFQGQYASQWPLLASATIIVAIPIIVIYASLQRYFVAGALSGAFKG